MAFNSIAFLVLIILFFSFWPFVKRKNNSRFLFITVSSFIFYGWWDWRFILLILFSGVVDYISALLIERWRNLSKTLLVLSLAVNLMSLGIFKYSGFIAIQLENIFENFGVEIDVYSALPPFTLILPVGISFYTFQSMSYTIDVYRGKLKPTNNILHFFSYLVMFPQLVAGPIVRAKDFLQQLAEQRKVSLLVFWNRWHISLSTWFRDYVYIPLGGNKKGRLRSDINMWITMLLSGLWHGAAINFVLWGAYHAFVLNTERVIGSAFKKKKNKKWNIVRWAGTMITVLIGWVLFRSPTFEQVISILRSMFYPEISLHFLRTNLNLVFFIVLALLYEGGYFLSKQTPLKRMKKLPIMDSIKYAIILMCILFLRGPEQEFIYFQF